jgi:hypothetical protein
MNGEYKELLEWVEQNNRKYPRRNKAPKTMRRRWRGSLAYFMKAIIAFSDRAFLTTTCTVYHDRL